MNLSIFIFCLFVNPINNDTNCCNASFFLIPKQQQISVYKESNHKNLSCYIINDTVTEYYFTGIIYEIKKDYAYVKGSYVFEEGNDIEGWIEKKYIGTNIISEDSVPLYLAPDFSAEKTYIIYPEWYPIEILECYGEWVYITYEDKNQKKSGWLHKKHQCSNPYTTCN